MIETFGGVVSFSSLFHKLDNELTSDLIIDVPICCSKFQMCLLPL